MKNHIAQTLKSVIGEALRRSGLGTVWRDDRTWQEFADVFAAKISSTHALVEKKVYDQLVRDAKQMAHIRRSVAAYHELVEKSKATPTASTNRMGQYERWAAENNLK